MVEQDSEIPTANTDIFALLYRIEVGLRELIIEELGALEGLRWHQKCLPGDVLAKAKEGKVAEQRIPWTVLVPHDPLYYVDFPDLRKIIEKTPNWNEAFKSIFIQKNHIVDALQTLEHIRNKIAHNRRATSSDLETTRTTYLQLMSAIGEERLTTLVLRCTSAAEAPESLRKLREEAKRSLESCCNCESLGPRDVWESSKQASWLSIVALDHDLTDIETYFALLDDYDRLPQTWPGFKLERWVKDKRVSERYARADESLQELKAECDKHGR